MAVEVVAVVAMVGGDTQESKLASCSKGLLKEQHMFELGLDLGFWLGCGLVCVLWQ